MIRRIDILDAYLELNNAFCAFSETALKAMLKRKTMIGIYQFDAEKSGYNQVRWGSKFDYEYSFEELKNIEIFFEQLASLFEKKGKMMVVFMDERIPYSCEYFELQTVFYQNYKEDSGSYPDFMNGDFLLYFYEDNSVLTYSCHGLITYFYKKGKKDFLVTETDLLRFL